MTISEASKKELSDSIIYLKDHLMENPDKLFETTLRILNLQRILDTEERKEVFCGLENGYIKNLFKCHIGCPFGHMTECHFPFTCNSDFCKHYKNQGIQSDKLGECCDAMREAIEMKFLAIKNNEIVFNIPLIPKESFNVLTGDVYNPKDFPLSLSLYHCPWCKKKLSKEEKTRMEGIYNDGLL